MWHPGEDELIQHLCGEADPAAQPRMDEHVRDCPDCRRACEQITGALTMVAATVPEPPDGFERVMWARVQRSLAATPPAAQWTWRQWLPAGALAAAAVAGVVLAGGQPRGTARATIDAATTEHDAIVSRVLYTALDSHFQQAEVLLVELRNATTREGLEFERISADELVSSGRLYRLTAERAGQLTLASVLDDLEPVLVEVARRSNRMTTEDLAWIRGRIDEDGLLFKVRAATQDIRERGEQ